MIKIKQKSQRLFKGNAYYFNIFAFLLSSILTLANGCYVEAAQDNAKKKVLLLNSYHKGFLWTDEITRAIEKVFENRDFDLHIEYMDTKRQFDPVYRELLGELLSWKHGQHQYDLVITSDNNAFEYFKEYGRKIFGTIPHVFCGVNYLKKEMLNSTFNCTGINEKADIQRNVDLITKLHPDVKKIMVVTDDTPTGKVIQQEVEKVKDRFKDSPKIELVFDVSLDELGESLKRLNPDTIVLYTLFFRDKNGVFFEFNESAAFISDHSPVPVYCIWSFSLGFGGVGGYLVDAYQQGDAAAKQAMEIFKGKPVSDIPILWTTPITIQFDYRALLKFNLLDRKLPPGSEILYKPTSFYFKYKTLIWNVSIAFFFLSVALIVTVFALIRVKRSENEVQQEKEKFLKFFHNSPVWMVVSTLEKGIFLNVNTAFFRSTGFPRDEVIGKSSIDFGLWVNPVDRNKMVDIIKEKGKSDAYPARLRMKDGTIRDFLWSAVLIELDGENCLLNTLIDITEIETARKEKDRLTQQLLHVQKMEAIGTLAGGIAHDFNNILSGIFGYAQLARSHVNNKDRALKDIDHLLKAAQRATELTRQILTFSRKTEYKKQSFNVCPEVKEALKLLRSSIPSTIEINQALESKRMILADPIKVHQVVMNLCTNAYHSMEEKGGTLGVLLTDIELLEPKTVKEKFMPPGQYVYLKVKDTGCGMGKEILEKAFDPYYTTKDIGHGTGLGLSLVKAIVEEHNGFIDVHSEIDKGTAFSVYFPAVKESVEKDSSENLRLSDLAGNETIMVVDDEKNIRDIYKSYLEDNGYKVHPFENGRTALEAFKINPAEFDLVITDLTMPEMTGDKLSEALLKIRPNLPVILCTGVNETLSVLESSDMGTKNIFQKPIVLIDLLNCIKQSFNRQAGKR